MESLWTWLVTPPGIADVLDPFGLIFAAVFGFGFLLSAYLAGPGGDDSVRDELKIKTIHHWATVGLLIFGSGLFFFAMRALQINPLSFGEPIWLLASVIALIVAAARFGEWRRKVDAQCGAGQSQPLRTQHSTRQDRHLAPPR